MLYLFHIHPYNNSPLLRLAPVTPTNSSKVQSLSTSKNSFKSRIWLKKIFWQLEKKGTSILNGKWIRLEYAPVFPVIKSSSSSNWLKISWQNRIWKYRKSKDRIQNIQYEMFYSRIQFIRTLSIVSDDFSWTEPITNNEGQRYSFFNFFSSILLQFRAGKFWEVLTYFGLTN